MATALSVLLAWEPRGFMFELILYSEAMEFEQVQSEHAGLILELILYCGTYSNTMSVQLEPLDGSFLMDSVLTGDQV